MTKQHKATPEQWHWKMMEELAPQNDRSPLPPCILELRARIEALEATRPPSPSAASTRRMLALQDQIRDGALTLADAVKEIGAARIRSGPESPLVERVADAIAAQATSAGIVNDRPARAAMLEVAAYIRQHNPFFVLDTAVESDVWEAVAELLEQEANRG